MAEKATGEENEPLAVSEGRHVIPATEAWPAKATHAPVSSAVDARTSAVTANPSRIVKRSATQDGR